MSSMEANCLPTTGGGKYPEVNHKLFYVPAAHFTSSRHDPNLGVGIPNTNLI